MADDGKVSRVDVIRVLRSKDRLFVAAEGDGPVVVSCDESSRTYPFPDRISRKTLHRLSLAYDIPIHLFFNPELIGMIKQ